MKFFTAIAAILLLFASQLQAQLMDSTGIWAQHTYTFHNHTYPDTLLRNTSYIIQELAIGNKVPQSEVVYKLKYETCLKRTDSAGNEKLALGVYLHKFYDPVIYKSFNINNLLLPSGLRVRINYMTDSHVLHSFELIERDLRKYDTTWIPLDTAKLNYAPDISLSSIDFFYKKAELKQVVNKFQLINDYYASKLIIDSVRALAEELHLGSAEHLPENLIFLFELRKINELVEGKEFHQSLGIKYHDPAQFQKSLRMLELLENRVQTLTDKSLDSALLITKQTIDDAFEYYIYLQKKYIKWAAQAEHSYQTSFYTLLKKVYYDEDLNFYNTYLTHLNAEHLLPYAYKSFYNKNLTYVDHCIKNQYYLIALGILESLESFVVLAPEYADNSLISRQSSRARHGLYGSYLRVANRAIQVRNFELAMDYLSRADDYQQNNTKYIISDIEVRKTRQQLSEAYLSAAKDKIDSGEFKEALNLIRLARFTANKYNDITLDDSLFSQLELAARKGVFQDYLATASACFNAGNYADARLFLNKAERYSRENKKLLDSASLIITLPAYESYLSEAKNRLLKQDYGEALLILEKVKNDNSPLFEAAEIDSMLYSAAEKQAQSLISHAERYLFNGKIEQAERELQQVRKLISQYNLNHGGIKEQLNSVAESFDQHVCKRKIRKYHNLLEHGYALLEKRAFINALEIFNDAASMQHELVKCGLIDTMADYAVTLYEDAAYYQKKLKEIKRNLFTIGFSNVIEDYVALEELYYQKNLRGVRLKHIPLDQFLLEQENPELIITAYHYYYEKENCKKTLQMLDLLSQLDYNKRSTRELQRNAAELCFSKDAEIPSPYTQKENKWFDYFRKRINALGNKQKLNDLFGS